MKSHPVAVLAALVAALAGVSRAQDAPREIAGRVVCAETMKPIAGAQVFGPGGKTGTDGAGRFALPAKPESEDQMILARAEGYALGHRPLDGVADGSEVVLELYGARVAAVRVVGEDGTPLRGATVRGRLPFAPAYSALERLDFNGVTNEDGVAVLTGLPADAPLVVEVMAPRMIPAQGGIVFPVPAPAAGETAPILETVIVTPGRSLRLIVEDQGRRPVEGADVRLLPLVEPRLDFGGHAGRDTTKGSIRTGLTDAAGNVAFGLLPANPITCEVRKAGMLTQLLVVEGIPGTPRPVRVRLDPDPDPPAADIPWRETVARASDESARTGRPIFLVMTMDGEKANDWMAAHHYHDREIVRAAREVIPLLSSAFGEGGVGADPGHKEIDGKCSRYGTISCFMHQLVEQAARETMTAEREVFEVPRHIATLPNGRRIVHRVFYLSERDLLRLLLHALRASSTADAVRLAKERLRAVVEDLASADVAIRSRGVAALAALANSGDEHAAALVQGIASLGLSPGTRAAIASGLHPRALAAPSLTLLDLIRDPAREVRQAIASRMAELATDPAMLDLLANELRTADADVRGALLAALGVERKANEIRVRNPAAGMRWRVVEELVELPEAGRLVGLDAELPKVSLPGRNRIIRALGRRAAADPAAQQLLTRLLDGESRVAALRALAPAAAVAGGKPPSPLPGTFAEAARSSDALLREEALRSFADLSIPVDSEVLAASLPHPSAPVRILAALALWRRGDRRGEAVLHGAVRDFERGADVRAALRN